MEVKAAISHAVVPTSSRGFGCTGSFSTPGRDLGVCIRRVLLLHHLTVAAQRWVGWGELWFLLETGETEARGDAISCSEGL